MSIVTRDVRKDLYRAFWLKAERFCQLMARAEADENWNGASLAGIHCAISSVDALLVNRLECRAASQRHQDAAQLLKNTRLPGADGKAKQFLDILELKTLVEYEPGLISENDARRLCLQAKRIHEWVKQQLEK